jgi:hypothetical protein
MAATTDFCVFCVIEGKLTPSIAWEGAPVCRECLADTMTNPHLPRCPLSALQSCEPQLVPSPSPGLSCTTLH